MLTKTFFRKHESTPKMMSATDIRGPVTYESGDHMAILFQMHGSVWLKVLPYSMVTLFLAFIIKVAKVRFGINLTFNDQGHMFMSTMVSVLMVTRSRIAYSRYMSARGFLSAVVRSCRELVQYLVTFTRYDSTQAAINWRGQVSACTVDLLFELVDVLQMNDKLTLHEMQSLFHAERRRNGNGQLLTVEDSTNINNNINDSPRDWWLKHQRNPLSMAIHLRSAIASHVKYLSRPLEANQELRLLSCTSDFVSAYHGLVKLITTPFPFPLVQMTRTSLFVWVFTLPFALMSNRVGFFAYPLTFFLTYGFIGLEVVSIELDDPFGNDANDINVMALVRVVLDDVLVCLEDLDGTYAASSLQNSYAKRLKETAEVLHNSKATTMPLGRLKKIISFVSKLRRSSINNEEQTCTPKVVVDPSANGDPNDSTVQELFALLPKSTSTSQQDEGYRFVNSYGCFYPQPPEIAVVGKSGDQPSVAQTKGSAKKNASQHQRKLSVAFPTIEEEVSKPSIADSKVAFNADPPPHDLPTDEERGAGFPIISLGGTKGNLWINDQPDAELMHSPTFVKKSGPSYYDEENIHPNLAKRHHHTVRPTRSQAGDILRRQRDENRQ